MVDHLPVRPGLLGDFVGGVWGPAEAGGTRADVSPADTSDVLGRFADSTAADAVRAVDAAAAALPAWRASGAIKRAEIVRRAERIIGEREDEFARAISREQGKLY